MRRPKPASGGSATSSSGAGIPGSFSSGAGMPGSFSSGAGMPGPFNSGAGMPGSLPQHHPPMSTSLYVNGPASVAPSSTSGYDSGSYYSGTGDGNHPAAPSSKSHSMDVLNVSGEQQQKLRTSSAGGDSVSSYSTVPSRFSSGSGGGAVSTNTDGGGPAANRNPSRPLSFVQAVNLHDNLQQREKSNSTSAMPRTDSNRKGGGKLGDKEIAV